MTVLRDHYYRLASEHPGERLEAASQLFTELAAADSREEWEYALNRLTKGLITSRQSARFGFSMALAEVVRELVPRPDYITADGYLDLVESTTQVRSAMKGKEERAVLFGRLFGLQILVTSDVLFNSSLVSENTTFRFVELLLKLASMKSWLRETAVFTLCGYLKKLDENENDSLFDRVALHVLQTTNDQGLNLLTEGIAIYLSIPRTKRAELAAQITSPKANWKHGDPLATGNLPVLARALKDVEVVDDPDSESAAAKKKGSWSPRLPFVWDILVEEFTQSAGQGKRARGGENRVSLAEFWRVVVDETLFAEKSSNERKFWGVEVFVKFLSAISRAEDTQYLFTRNMLRCLINHSAQPNRFLHRAAHAALRKVVLVGQENYMKAPVMVSRLLDEENGGCWNFDLLTKTKTVDGLLLVFGGKSSEDVREDEAKAVLSQLCDLLVRRAKAAILATASENVVRWYMDKLVLLVRSSRQVDSGATTEEVVKFFIRHGFFEKEKKEKKEKKNKKDKKDIDEDKNEQEVQKTVGPYQKACQDKLNTLLGEIIEDKRADGSSWAHFCVAYVLKLEGSDKYRGLVEFDEEIAEVRQEAVTTLESVHEMLVAGTARSDQFYCFEMLFAMALMQLQLGEDEAVAVLGDLRFCYETTFLGRDDEDRNEEVTPDIVLIEIVLSFMSRPSSLLKKFSHVVWRSLLCGKTDDGRTRVQRDGLQLLFNVLVQRENKQGQQELFDENPEIEVEDEGSEGDNEEEESENEDDEEEAEEEDGHSRIDDLDKETNIKLAAALGIPTSDSGEVKFEDISSEDEGAESESMDDEDMMAMDDQLARIFKERHDAISKINPGDKKKKEAASAKEQMLFFKSRVLDLLELYCKANPNVHFNLYALQPLITMINITVDKTVGVKAHKLLKTRIAKTRVDADDLALYYPTEAAQTEYKDSLLQMLRELQHEANTKKLSNQLHALACNQACIVVAKNLVELDEGYLERVIDEYGACMKAWATSRKSRIQASMFFDFVNWVKARKERKE